MPQSQIPCNNILNRSKNSDALMTLNAFDDNKSSPQLIAFNGETLRRLMTEYGRSTL
uniref:Uncharacterized protein n=1 Tax=Meloidogyne enterolobii TaxID=390850 RepID=A0A6V7Y968_MELEN|nr:unnamed protein product [Meloidogyne enterolobii]